MIADISNEHKEDFRGSGVSAKPRVSVVIPAYNRSSMLVEAVQSVMEQTYRHFEVIVVDDGSGDDTSVKMAEFGDSILYSFQENRGVAAARNHGIRLSRGEFLCFLDSDDLWKPTKLEQQIEFADSHPEYGLISTEIDGFSAECLHASRTKAKLYDIRNGHVVEQLLFANWIQTSTVMLRRKCVDTVGMFDEDVGQFGEDWLLWMRIAAQYPIYFMPQPLVKYRIHSDSLSSHVPEAQYDSLMLILERLRSLDVFRSRQHLLDEASYKISLGRGRNDLHAGAYPQAMRKLRNACATQRIPLQAAYWLVIAELANKFYHGRSAMPVEK